MYAYLLPNGARIDAERVTDAALATQEYPQTYLDTETGMLVEIPSADALEHWVSEIGATKRYFLIERFDDTDRNAIAREYVDGLLKEMATPSETAGARDAFENGGWQGMETFLMEHTDGWIHGWNQYISDEAGEYVHDWLTNNPHVSIKAEFEGCGNCALCELIRKGEGGNLPKLMNAFAVENTLQQVGQQVEERTKGIVWRRYAKRR